jgi:hypothetical protein
VFDGPHRPAKRGKTTVQLSDELSKLYKDMRIALGLPFYEAPIRGYRGRSLVGGFRYPDVRLHVSHSRHEVSYRPKDKSTLKANQSGPRRWSESIKQMLFVRNSGSTNTGSSLLQFWPGTTTTITRAFRAAESKWLCRPRKLDSANHCGEQKPSNVSDSGKCGFQISWLSKVVRSPCHLILPIYGLSGIAVRLGPHQTLWDVSVEWSAPTM